MYKKIVPSLMMALLIGITACTKKDNGGGGSSGPTPVPRPYDPMFDPSQTGPIPVPGPGAGYFRGQRGEPRFGPVRVGEMDCPQFKGLYRPRNGGAHSAREFGVELYDTPIATMGEGFSYDIDGLLHPIADEHGGRFSFQGFCHENEIRVDFFLDGNPIGFQSVALSDSGHSLRNIIEISHSGRRPTHRDEVLVRFNPRGHDGQDNHGPQPPPPPEDDQQDDWDDQDDTDFPDDGPTPPPASAVASPPRVK